jgi:lactate racemase
MPGVSTRGAMQTNHSKIVDKNAYAGNLDTNPVRTDI